MRWTRPSILALLCVATFSSKMASDAAGTAQEARRQHPPPVCLYEEANYRGRSFCSSCAYESVPAELMRKFSSVRIPGGYSNVELFEGVRFSGERLVLRQSQPDLGACAGGVWNKRISSFRGTIPRWGGCYYGVPGGLSRPPSG
jgi:hypothetical protein